MKDGSLIWHVGDVTYKPRHPNALEMHLGATKVYEWTHAGAIGYVALSGGPMLCSCRTTICRHIADVRGFEDSKHWDVPPRPAA